jgi:arylsulfatase A-like enzyme
MLLARLTAALPLFAGLAATTTAAQAAPATPAKPNFVFLLADDLGYGDLGSFGQREIHTANLDRLAAAGTRFTNAYAGTAVCAPSRCSLMTGLHVGHASVRGNSRAPGVQSLKKDDVTLAQVLKPAGYATGLVGKWGLVNPDTNVAGLPTRHGFDFFYGYLNQTQAHNSYPSFLWRNETKIPLPNVVPNEQPNGAGVSSNKAVFSDDLLLQESLGFIRAHRDGPFLLCFTPTLPHANNESTPLGLEVPDLGEYRDRDWPAAKKAYAAMVTRLDHDVGEFLALLKELHLEENTVVIFTSDNGPHREGGYDPEFFHSAGPFRGIKRDLYEGGIREPTIARWPGHIPAGATSEAAWDFADVLPTFADLAGAPIPAGLDGVSIVPALLGHPQPALAQRFLYWEIYEGGFKQAARRGDWKAVIPRLDAPIELYDLAHDVGEQHNLASQEPKLAAEFGQYLHAAHVDSPDWPVR